MRSRLQPDSHAASVDQLIMNQMERLKTLEKQIHFVKYAVTIPNPTRAPIQTSVKPSSGPCQVKSLSYVAWRVWSAMASGPQGSGGLSHLNLPKPRPVLQLRVVPT